MTLLRREHNKHKFQISGNLDMYRVQHASSTDDEYEMQTTYATPSGEKNSMG
jgi:hypothetical protein